MLRFHNTNVDADIYATRRHADAARAAVYAIGVTFRADVFCRSLLLLRFTLIAFAMIVADTGYMPPLICLRCMLAAVDTTIF